MLVAVLENTLSEHVHDICESDDANRLLHRRTILSKTTLDDIHTVDAVLDEKLEDISERIVGGDSNSRRKRPVGVGRGRVNFLRHSGHRSRSLLGEGRGGSGLGALRRGLLLRAILLDLREELTDAVEKAIELIGRTNHGTNITSRDVTNEATVLVNDGDTSHTVGVNEVKGIDSLVSHGNTDDKLLLAHTELSNRAISEGLESGVRLDLVAQIREHSGLSEDILHVQLVICNNNTVEAILTKELQSIKQVGVGRDELESSNRGSINNILDCVFSELDNGLENGLKTLTPLGSGLHDSEDECNDIEEIDNTEISFSERSILVLIFCFTNGA